MLSFNETFYILEGNPEDAENMEIAVNADEDVSMDETQELEESAPASPAVPYIIGGVAGAEHHRGIEGRSAC